MCNFKDTCDFAQTGHDVQPRPHPQPHPRRCPFPQAVARQNFAKGDFLYHQGDSVRGALHLTKGLVALERVDEAGRLVILKVLRPEVLFPCAELFAGAAHGSTARALSDGQACFIPREKVLSAMADSESRTTLLKCGADEARDSENAIFRLCAGDLSDQIMATLRTVLDAPHHDGEMVHGTLPLAWRDIAALVGTSPEVMSRTVRRLVRQGALNVKGRTVTLHPQRNERQRRALYN